MRNQKLRAHLFDLSRIFGKQISVEDFKRLAEIEKEGHALAEDYCNGVVDTDEHTRLERRLISEVNRITCADEGVLHFNSDPRGYFLKISDEYLRKIEDFDISMDWGGYGVIVPDEVQS